jgi:hypothetical protein
MASFKRLILLFDKGNYQLPREKYAAVNWEELKDTNIDTYANNISDAILKFSKSCIPNKQKPVRPSDPPWITSHLKLQIRRRRRAYRKAKRTNNAAEWTKFRSLRNQIINQMISDIRKSKDDHIQKLAANFQTSSRSTMSWLSCLKSFIKPSNDSSTIPPLQDGDGLFEDEQCKVDIINNYFRDQTILDENPTQIIEEEEPSPHKLDSIVTSATEVESLLQTLTLGKASGPDGINKWILKELSKELSIPLSDLFSQSLRTSRYPHAWKEANVNSIFKSGDRSLPVNYRPVSVFV